MKRFMLFTTLLLSLTAALLGCGGDGKDEPKPTEQPKTETVKTDSPKTGDESNVKLWTTISAIAAVGGIALIGFTFSKKGKRKGK